jgi:hypothetical protein
MQVFSHLSYIIFGQYLSQNRKQLSLLPLQDAYKQGICDSSGSCDSKKN